MKFNIVFMLTYFLKLYAEFCNLVVIIWKFLKDRRVNSKPMRYFLIRNIAYSCKNRASAFSLFWIASINAFEFIYSGKIQSVVFWIHYAKFFKNSSSENTNGVYRSENYLVSANYLIFMLEKFTWGFLTRGDVSNSVIAN